MPAVLSLPRAGRSAGASLYDFKPSGNARVLHMTDTHAQLSPVFFREPSVNIGIGSMKGHPPHLVGEHFLKKFGLKPGTPEAYAFTFLDFENAAHRYGKMGGFAHLRTLVKMLRSAVPDGHSILLDGGDL